MCFPSNSHSLKPVLRRRSVYSKQEQNFIQHFVRIVDPMNETQIPNPIANGVFVLLAPDNACVRYALRCKPEKVRILGANDMPQIGCVGQLQGIVRL